MNSSPRGRPVNQDPSSQQGRYQQPVTYRDAVRCAVGKHGAIGEASRRDDRIDLQIKASIKKLPGNQADAAPTVTRRISTTGMAHHLIAVC